MLIGTCALEERQISTIILNTILTKTPTKHNFQIPKSQKRHYFRLMLDIKPTLDIRLISNITSSALFLQLVVLYIRKSKGLDYPSTNFFPC